MIRFKNIKNKLTLNNFTRIKIKKNQTQNNSTVNSEIWTYEANWDSYLRLVTAQ